MSNNLNECKIISPSWEVYQICIKKEKMNKEILLSNDEKIEEYNTFNIITNKKYKEEKIKKDSIRFFICTKRNYT